MKYTAFFLFSIAIVVWVMWLLTTRREHFSNDVADKQDLSLNTYDVPKPDANGLRPCTVYFTDRINACNSGEMRFNRNYYSEKVQDIKNAINARNGEPMPDELEKLSLLNKMVAAYDALPYKKICKTEIPNWYELADANKPPLGTILRNDERNPADQWGFCFKRNGSAKDVENTKLQVEKDDKGKLQGTTIGGAFYLRGKFPDFGVSTVQSIYCKETADVKPYVFQDGFKIENARAAKPVYKIYRDGVIATIDQSIIDRFFTNIMFQEMVTNENGHEITAMVPQPQIMPCRKLYNDLCGRWVVEYSGKVNIRFRDRIIQKRIKYNIDQDHLLGSAQDLRNTKAASIKRSDDWFAKITKTKNTLATLNATLAARKADLVTAIAKIAEASANYDDTVILRDFAEQNVAYWKNQAVGPDNAWNILSATTNWCS
jgi:hypothetical protein